MPFSASTRQAATDTVKIAGCVFAVSFSSSSVPAQHIAEIENPSALSASSNVARATGYISASSFPIPGYCEAWPGNINATFPIPTPLSSPSCFVSRLFVCQAEFLLDLFVHTCPRQPRSHANRILNRIRIGPPVGNHANPAYTQKWRTAGLRVIHGLLQTLQRTLGEQIA